MPIGMFTRNTAGQPNTSVSTPPRMAPAAAPDPATAPQMPSARLRSGPGAKIVITSESAAGATSAAPRPWPAREATSQTAFCASPPSSEATTNSAMPIMNSRRRPSRSASRPPRSRKPPNASVYALNTHDRSAGAKPRSPPTEGSATFTIAASRISTKMVVASSANARHGEGAAKEGAAESDAALPMPSVNSEVEFRFRFMLYTMRNGGSVCQPI